ncbi:DUF6151 family protein [Shimia sp.]|uniref:DUF6151 family protein n=1 Tax=Shimia sp. TaxID=1954381 RepID=UPI003299DD64
MTDGATLDLKCRCGSFRAEIKDASPETGSHLVCYCKDCQAFARFLKAEELLKPRGGTGLFQTVPSRVQILQGKEHLACLRLSPKGPLRWYASCCDTPVCNTLSSRKLAFAGFMTPNFEGDNVAETVGPVVAVVHTQGAGVGPGDLQNRGFLKVSWQILRRHFGELLSGRLSKTPFFDADGQPTAAPRMLTLEERKAATPE